MTRATVFLTTSLKAQDSCSIVPVSASASPCSLPVFRSPLCQPHTQVRICNISRPWTTKGRLSLFQLGNVSTVSLIHLPSVLLLPIILSRHGPAGTADKLGQFTPVTRLAPVGQEVPKHNGSRQRRQTMGYKQKHILSPQSAGISYPTQSHVLKLCTPGMR